MAVAGTNVYLNGGQIVFVAGSDASTVDSARSDTSWFTLTDANTGRAMRLRGSNVIALVEVVY